MNNKQLKIQSNARDAMSIQKKSSPLYLILTTKSISMVILSAAVLLSSNFSVLAQPAKGANKFLGNITTWNQVRSDFLQYWNQITGENESKWSSIEGQKTK